MTVRCRWCGAAATGTCTTKVGGKTEQIPYCGPEAVCWTKTYETVRRSAPRTWTQIRIGQAGHQQTDLLDLLPPDRKASS